MLMLLIFKLLLGTCLLLAGRELFWLFVGFLGLWGGFHAGTLFFSGENEWKVVGFALVCGSLGMVIAMAFQATAIVVSGFLAGMYLVVRVLAMFGVWPVEQIWPVLLLGGVAGSALLAVLFSPIMIVLSSLVGAMLIVEDLGVGAFVRFTLFVCLFVAGTLIQAEQLKSKD